MKLYIREKNEKLNELAYYGPFEESEINHRLNDAFADWMASGGANIDAVLLSFSEASNMYINPREFWMSQLETLVDIQSIRSGAPPDDLGWCAVCTHPLTRNGCENVSQHPRTLSHI